MSRPTLVEGYYRLHAPIYDLTRWSFLFGRREAVRWVGRFGVPQRILEVGCGTGHNLRLLAEHYPEAEIAGVDLSPDMLRQAERQTAAHRARVRLHEAAYGMDGRFTGWPDVILFSYSLTMMGEAVPVVLDAAMRDLRPGGSLVALDFDDTPHPMFRRWMQRNHVDVDGSVRSALQERLQPLDTIRRPAWGGTWTWFLLAGRPA